MNCKGLIILIFSVFGMNSQFMANEGHYEALFEKANEVYKAGNYDSAKGLDRKSVV